MPAFQTVRIEPSFEGWRAAARQLLRADVPPDAIAWRELEDAQLDALEQDGDANAPTRAHDAARGLVVRLDDVASARLKAGGPPGPDATRDATRDAAPRVPRRFVEAATTAACHADPRRWALLYRVLWRLTHGEPRLLEVAVDDDVYRLLRMDKAVRHDVHKLHAFVRFRRVAGEPGEQAHGTTTEQYVAWFVPTHDCLALAAPFFARRFPNMRWSILGPRRSAHWDGSTLLIGAGMPREAAPAGDALEQLWRTYYASIFNPARARPRAMRAEMPKKYWHQLPEASIVSELLADAPARVRRMIEAEANPPRRPRTRG
jgi:uracil-DNA glycosylase